MKTVVADDRGRILFGRKLLETYGRKFAVVGTPKELVLIPISNDPLTELKKIGSESLIYKYSINELRKLAKNDAQDEVFRGKNVR